MKKIILFSALLALVCTVGSSNLFSVENDRAASLAAFAKMTPVLQHPRCLACHPNGDRPLQGVDLHPHIMNVQRGPDDHGAVGMRCATCHGEANNENSGVPGAPNWRLAPRSMAWVGLNAHQLCLTIKDMKKNHGMTLEQLIHHNGEDSLVGWAWHPGADRVPAPGTQKEFGENTRKWVESGAACPD